MTLVWIDGHAEFDRELVGGTAHGPNRMHALALPASPAFALSTQVCGRFCAGGGIHDNKSFDAVRLRPNHRRNQPHDLIVAASGRATDRTILTTDQQARFGELPDVNARIIS